MYDTPDDCVSTTVCAAHSWNRIHLALQHLLLCVTHPPCCHNLPSGHKRSCGASWPCRAAVDTCLE
jgi:hypothetical protein